MEEEEVAVLTLLVAVDVAFVFVVDGGTTALVDAADGRLVLVLLFVGLVAVTVPVAVASVLIGAGATACCFFGLLFFFFFFCLIFLVVEFSVLSVREGCGSCFETAVGTEEEEGLTESLPVVFIAGGNMIDDALAVDDMLENSPNLPRMVLPTIQEGTATIWST